MGRAPCCEKMGLKKGPWTSEEDHILTNYIQLYGHGNWRALPKLAGLLRCGKSCRLRWTNYLRPDIKRGNFTREEEDTIIELHNMLGNRWSTIAAKLPGRTDNEIKNVWHTHLKKRAMLMTTSPTKQNDDQQNNPLPHPVTNKRRSPSGKKTKSISSIIKSDQAAGEPADSTAVPVPVEYCSSDDASSLTTATTGENNDAVKAEDVSSREEYLNNEEMDESFWSEVLSAENSSSAVEPELGSGLFRFDSLVNSSGTVGGGDDQEGEAAAAAALVGDSNVDYSSMDFWYNFLTGDGELSALPSI